MMPTSASSELTRTMGRCRVTRVESSFSRCSGVNVASAVLGGALIAMERLDIKAGVKVFGNRRCTAEITLELHYKNRPVVAIGRRLTATAPQISFSVLQRASPSITAPANSSTYFSNERVSMSFIICSRLSAAKDRRMRVIKAVCRFREESSFAVSTHCITPNSIINAFRIQPTLNDHCGIELFELYALCIPTFLIVYSLRSCCA